MIPVSYVIIMHAALFYVNGVTGMNFIMTPHGLLHVNYLYMFPLRTLLSCRLFADIDADGDGNVTREEVKLWVERIERKAVEDQFNAEWQAFNTDGDYEVTWEEYKTGALQSEDNTYVYLHMKCACMSANQ